MSLNPITLAKAGYAGAKVASRLVALAYRSAPARTTMLRKAGQVAYKEVTNPKELAKNVGIVALKPAKVASVAYGISEASEEGKRMRKAPDAKKASPDSSVVGDGVRTAIKIASIAYIAHPMNWTKNKILAVGYLGSALNSGAAGRTAARLGVDPHNLFGHGKKVATNGATKEGGPDSHAPAGGTGMVREHPRLNANGTVSTVQEHAAHK